LNGAFAPSGLGFDPQARSAIVEYPIVLVMIKVAVALEQAEAARIMVEKGVEAQARRIDQGAPHPLTTAGP